jgi:hypothetical protein
MAAGRQEALKPFEERASDAEVCAFSLSLSLSLSLPLCSVGELALF